MVLPPEVDLLTWTGGDELWRRGIKVRIKGKAELVYEWRQGGDKCQG